LPIVHKKDVTEARKSKDVQKRAKRDGGRGEIDTRTRREIKR
jgi:hypothetical protein